MENHWSILFKLYPHIYCHSLPPTSGTSELDIECLQNRNTLILQLLFDCISADLFNTTLQMCRMFVIKCRKTIHMYQNILWIEDSGMPCIRKAQVSKFINPPTAFEHVFWQISPQDLSESAWQNSHIILS